MTKKIIFAGLTSSLLLLSGCSLLGLDKTSTTDNTATARCATINQCASNANNLGFKQSVNDASSPNKGTGQIAIPFNTSDENVKKTADTATQTDDNRLIPNPRTFLGSIPCFTGQSCQVQRLNLSLAPNGQWRARATPLAPAGKPQLFFGCWKTNLTQTELNLIDISKGQNASIALLSKKDQYTLKVTQIANKTPSFDYTLTVQADLDPINELSSKNASYACPNPF